MMPKTWTFEELGPNEDLGVNVELDYSYSFDGGNYCGPPEDCYPAEEDGEICEPVDLASVVVKALPNEPAEVHVSVLAEIRKCIEDMNKDLGLVAEWYNDEDHENYYDED